jgi:hypothetical protein
MNAQKTMNCFRSPIVQRLVAALLLPFVLVATNGSGFAWAIYEWEWEDILTHHYQTLDPNNTSNKALGRTFVCKILDQNTGQDPTQPKPPVVLQELRAVLAVQSFSEHTLINALPRITPSSEGTPRLGFYADVFRPPTFG